MDAGCFHGVLLRDSGSRLCCSLRSPDVHSLARAPTGICPPRRHYSSDPAGYLASAESTFAAGRAAEEAGDPAAIDLYYATAASTWQSHVAGAAIRDDPGSELYRAAVRKLIETAIRCGRFDPTRGLTLGSGQLVPIRYFGFIWQPSDFCTLIPVGSYDSPEILHRYVSAGVGVEYVVLANCVLQRPFVTNNQPFAATAVLQPGDPSGA